jgi:hypothetical protein
VFIPMFLSFAWGVLGLIIFVRATSEAVSVFFASPTERSAYLMANRMQGCWGEEVTV